jgi:hypothetical protein
MLAAGTGLACTWDDLLEREHEMTTRMKKALRTAERLAARCQCCGAALGEEWLYPWVRAAIMRHAQAAEGDFRPVLHCGRVTCLQQAGALARRRINEMNARADEQLGGPQVASAAAFETWWNQWTVVGAAIGCIRDVKLRSQLVHESVLAHMATETFILCRALDVSPELRAAFRAGDISTINEMAQNTTERRVIR